MPPIIIWSGKSLSPKQTIGEIPGTLHGFSARGWMDCELFNLWFSELFLHYAPKARPLLLSLDGHSSHYCPDTIRLAAKEKVVIFTFPPNTTHLTQPLDKGVFRPLKLRYIGEKNAINFVSIILMLLSITIIFAPFSQMLGCKL